MRAAAILTFDKSLSPGQTTANNCKTAFSLHVVESASDDYNFQLLLRLKNQSFRNKSGKAQPILTKFDMCTCQR